MLNPHRPLRVAVLCSHRAPGLLYLLNRSPERGTAYEIVCCLTSARTFAEEVRVERRGIPTLVHPIQEFYKSRGASTCSDLGVREAYDTETAKLLEPYFPDVLLLDGYMYLVTAPLLRAFPAHTLNLHFGDLAIRRPDNSPRFVGTRAVRDAILGGCAETRATVHLVTLGVNAGPSVVRSWPFPVSPLVRDLMTLNAADVVKAYVYAHQQWMMRTVSGPLVAAALRLMYGRSLDLDALAAGELGATTWLLDRNGALLSPERQLLQTGR